jgi:hypothetical protein
MMSYFFAPKSRDSAVGITTSYGLDDRGDRSSSPGRVKNFLSPNRPNRLYYPMGTGGSFPGGKAAGA